MLTLTKKNFIILSLTIFILLLPVIGYIASVNKIEILTNIIKLLNLSTKNEDWGSFGSFISGMYGSIFSFLSLVAVLASLYFTQKNNREQVSILKTEQYTSEFLVLLDTLKKSLSEKKYDVLNIDKSFDSFAPQIYFLVGIAMQENYSIDETNIDKYALSYTSGALQKREKDVFEREYPLMSEIILRIKIANETQSMTYLAILKSQLSNDVIFMLCAFMYNRGRDRNRIDRTPGLFVTPEGLKKEALKQLALRR